MRAVGGLSTREIASAFMVPEATLAQRISRAKQALRAEGATFAGLTPSERGLRLPAVLRVLYLIFDERQRQALSAKEAAATGRNKRQSVAI